MILNILCKIFQDLTLKQGLGLCMWNILSEAVDEDTLLNDIFSDVKFYIVARPNEFPTIFHS